MQSHKVTRDGLPPIIFTGEHLAHASTKTVSGPGQNRWTEVDLYKTQGGNYIAAVVRYTIWEGESDRYSAKSFTSVPDVIEWLKEGEDRLGSASQEAVEKAACCEPAFAEAWVEHVD